ncbi:hypothetical protein BEN47_00190 [Hymenobacter lapidarius]|uniref:Glycosyltransferase RgtA/B/C/D-like domain-containing protein n=1 Tax=Hymenobacter lapidarius TaxID=1908237 RepID=A0A1G1T9S3_9BACT|nr:hypothetical protein [Hymenobacter lapidarius]OGX87629.1 hypothetical protein BEN47_00190 [Hymenobacter lapidarius]
MSNHTRRAIFLRVVLLPLGLVLGTVAGLGSYYESSDDSTLAWLFSGVLALQPVPSVPLYFHGYGHVLAAAYTAMPGVSWFGWLLGGLLIWATVLTFAVLDGWLRPRLPPQRLALALLGFFLLAWLEHVLWFSFVRVALLLAGASVLFAAQRPGRWGALLVGLLGVGAAWLMRPSLALVAVGAVLPAAVLLAGGWRKAAPLLGSAFLGLALAAALFLWQQTPTEARTQMRDAYFAQILDFDQLRPQPRTPADSLGTAALGLWLMGDTTVVNAGLRQRAYRFDAAYFLQREVPAKLLVRAVLLVRDYFPLLLALVLNGLIVVRRGGHRGWFWLVQLGFAAGLVVLAGIYKLPARLAMPLLDFWVLTNLAFLFKAFNYSRAEPVSASLATVPALGFKLLFSIRERQGILVLGVLAISLYGVKTLHRYQVLSREQYRHELAWAQLAQRTAGTTRILAGTNDLLKSLSPFRVYTAGPGLVLELSGWQSHDPSQAALRRHLTGAPGQAECLRRLALAAPATQWLLSAETAQWLNRRSRFEAAGRVPVVTLETVEVFPADTSLYYYRPVVR